MKPIELNDCAKAEALGYLLLLHRRDAAKILKNLADYTWTGISDFGQFAGFGRLRGVPVIGLSWLLFGRRLANPPVR